MKKTISILLFLFIFNSFVFSAVAQNDSPMKILSQPTPQLTEEQRKTSIHMQGTVTLRVEFLANGQIGSIVPVSGLPYGFTESAIEAAKQIEFEPAVKNGVPTKITKTIQYSFLLGWIPSQIRDEKAEAIVQLAYQKLGGANLLQVKNQVSTGFFSVFSDGIPALPNSFIDVIAFPDKERTEFKQQGNKVIQTNLGEKGWVYDAAKLDIREQGPNEIENFKRGIRTSLDALFRGTWRGQGGTLTYVGKREAGLGKRNDVVKLTYSDGLVVEYEFSQTDGMPMKSIYKKKNDEGTEIKEEDRYAQFVEIQGVLVPFIVDHYTDGKQTSRINYEKIEINKKVSDSIFEKPSDVKQLKKDLKF